MKSEARNTFLTLQWRSSPEEMGRGAEEYNISFSSLDFACSSFFQEIQVHGNSGHKFSIDADDVLHQLSYENLRLFLLLYRAPRKPETNALAGCAIRRPFLPTDYRHMSWTLKYLTIIPRAQMGYESIAHEAEGRMGNWLRAHEGERNNCFSKIQLVGQKNIETKHLTLVKARLKFALSRRFSLLVGYNK